MIPPSDDDEYHASVQPEFPGPTDAEKRQQYSEWRDRRFEQTQQRILNEDAKPGKPK